MSTEFTPAFLEHWCIQWIWYEYQDKLKQYNKEPVIEKLSLKYKEARMMPGKTVILWDMYYDGKNIGVCEY